jgi:hypothetical protein
MNIWQALFPGIVTLGMATAVTVARERAKVRRVALQEAQPNVGLEIGYGGDSASRFYVVRLINNSYATAYDIQLYIPGIADIAFKLPELKANQATTQNLRFSDQEPVVREKQEGLQARLLYCDLYGREFVLFQDLTQMPRADGFYNVGQDVAKKPTLKLPHDNFRDRWKKPQRKF